MSIRRLVVAFALMTVLAPSMAHADTYIAPFIGWTFGANAGRPLNAVTSDPNRTTWGVGFGAMGGGIFGVDLDIGYTPDFYTEVDAVVTKNSLFTVMPSLILGIPLGGQTGFGVRPYVLGGIGLVRRDVDFSSLSSVASFEQNDLAYNIGGGVIIYFTDHVGMRGDLRYFRNFKEDDFDLSGISLEPGTFDLGRGSAAVVFRF